MISGLEPIEWLGSDIEPCIARVKVDRLPQSSSALLEASSNELWLVKCQGRDRARPSAACSLCTATTLHICGLCGVFLPWLLTLKAWTPHNYSLGAKVGTTTTPPWSDHSSSLAQHDLQTSMPSGRSARRDHDPHHQAQLQKRSIRAGSILWLRKNVNINENNLMLLSAARLQKGSLNHPVLVLDMLEGRPSHVQICKV